MAGPCAVVTSALVLVLCLCGTAAASTTVTTFPIAGSRYNRPTTQISLRGAPARQLGSIQVAGSQSGVHSGRLLPHSDGNGASFVPNQPFVDGETVTVSTHLSVVGSTNGTFSFGIAHTWGLLPPGKLPLIPAGRNGVQHFHSRRDLQPAAVTVSENHAPASEGDIFVAPQFGPTQNGPMILDPYGNLVWFLPRPVSQNTLVTDFRVQRLHGQPVLTWWQGSTNAGHGRGVGEILNADYRQIATVRAGNGLDAGLHEFMVTPQGDAWITSSSPVHWGGVNRPTVDSVIQEIDIKTGLVLFEWHALDHIPVSYSYFTPRSPGHIFDPFHVNSISIAADGNPVVSMRNTSAVYEIDHRTGQVLWTLGGKHPSFRMGPGTSTWGQHNATVQPDGTLTIFDDGAGPPRVHPYSRGIRESLDFTHGTSTLLQSWSHSRQLSANYEGSLQVLSGGNVFMGWGQQPYFSEDNASGRQIFDAHFNVPTSSYRAYRFPWNAQPPTRPALAVAPKPDGSTSLYASWNGATNVSSWRVLGGSTPTSLAPVGVAGKRGFETDISVHSSTPYFAVQALGSNRQVLATSAATVTPPHIAVYGHSVFVPPGSGMGGLPVGCFMNHPCRVTTSVWAGHKLLARSGREYMAAGSAGVLYFRLARFARTMLEHARGRRLPVQITVRDSSGTRTTATGINLVPFYTSGRGPHRSLSNSSMLRIIGVTDFVSHGWVGGILTGCLGGSPCYVSTTLSVGATTIARTGNEFIGSNGLAYLMFTLTPQGHALLSRAPGNQLGARLTLKDGNVTASANIALVQFR